MLQQYLKSAKLLKVMLERSTPGARVELHFNGWPENAATLDTADSIVTISDGQDGHLGSPVPFMTPERMAFIERQMKRGCGFGLIHFSTFGPMPMVPKFWRGAAATSIGRTTRERAIGIRRSRRWRRGWNRRLGAIRHCGALCRST